MPYSLMPDMKSLTKRFEIGVTLEAMGLITRCSVTPLTKIKAATKDIRCSNMNLSWLVINMQQVLVICVPKGN